MIHYNKVKFEMKKMLKINGYKQDVIKSILFFNSINVKKL